MKNHLLIAGTGRAGTSLLVKLFTELGLETHLSARQAKAGWNDDANAGLEDRILHSGSGVAPYVVKSPWLFQSIDEVLANDNLCIDGVIIPVRDLAEAATSRTILEFQNIHAKNPWFTEELSPWHAWGTTPGGALYSLNPLDQARLLAVGFHHLVERLVTASIPIYLLAFPRFTEDPEYFYRTLKDCLPSSVTKEKCISAYEKLVDPQKVRVTAELGGNVLSSPENMPSLEKVDNVALRRELVKLRSKFSAVEEEARQTAAEKTSLQAVKNSLEDEIVALRSEVAEFRHIVSVQEAKIVQQQSEIITGNQQVVEARQIIKEQQSEITISIQNLEEIYRSTSWRVTSPIRIIINKMTYRKN